MQGFSNGGAGGLECGRVNKRSAGARLAVPAAAAAVAALVAGAQLVAAPATWDGDLADANSGDNVTSGWSVHGRAGHTYPLHTL